MRLPRASTFIAFGVALHVALICLATLPASRFSQTLYPLHAWYLGITNQSQNWAMYQVPDQARADYHLIVTFPDGSEERPWGSSTQMKPRQTYFLEALLLNRNNQDLAWRFLGQIHDSYPPARRPTLVLLQRTAQVVSPFERASKDILGEKLLPIELRRTW